MTNPERGLTHYRAGAERRRGPKAILAALIRKTELKAEMERLTAEITDAVQMLAPDAIAELQNLLAGEAESCDADFEDLRQQAEHEAQLAESITQTPTVRLTRRAIVALGVEAERRIQRGSFASSVETLVSEAVQRAFGEGVRP